MTTTCHQHTLQAIWVLGLIGSWFKDLANPNNGLNLVPNCV